MSRKYYRKVHRRLPSPQHGSAQIMLALAQAARVLAITIGKKLIAVARKLRDEEKRIEPQALEVLHRVEVAVIDTAAKTTPKAKKMAWSFGKILVVVWLVIVAIMVVASLIAAWK